MNKYQSAIIILNGKQSANPELRSAINRIRGEGHNVWVRIPWEAQDTKLFIEDAIEKKVDTVIAAGGDGSINAVSTALMQIPPPLRPVLGILPMGTANDFATSANIPLDIEAALSLAIKGKATTIDIGQINDHYYFINMATGGFGTRVTTETPEVLKSALGGAAYIINGLLRPDTLKIDSCKIEIEDFHWEGEILVAAIGNGRQAGGGQQLTPHALINDGLLNLVIIPARDVIPAFLTNVFSTEKNGHLIEKSSPWIKISSPHNMVFNLDGEPLSGDSFTFKLLPNALQCRLPPQCSLLV